MTDVIATYPAYRLIGFDGDLADAGFFEDEIPATCAEAQGRLMLRIKGGRALYEAITNRDGKLDARGVVQIGRLDVRDFGLHLVYRLIDEDTEIEVIA